MNRNLEILSIYLTGLFQGLVLVIVPAASLIFTAEDKFGFSSSAYGFLFVPQVLMAIVASLLGPGLVRQWGMKRVYGMGLSFNLCATILIAASQLWVGHHQLAYVSVFLGTACVGAGFGATLPTINVYATNFFPKNTASALTVLHTLLGTGTALAPVLVTVLVKGIGWWLLPAIMFVLLLVLLAVVFILPFSDERAVSSVDGPSLNAGAFLPPRVRLFMLIVLLYGYCETIFANWAIIFLHKERGVGLQEAGYALAGFWVMVSVGRLLISLLSVWIDPRWVYRILPVLITGALLGVSWVHSAASGIILFALAGGACSGIFPLTFSFGQKGFESIAERVSGWIMASYMLGYGAAAYGIGTVIELTHASLGRLYVNSIAAGIGVVFLAFLLTSREPAPNPAPSRK